MLNFVCSVNTTPKVSTSLTLRHTNFVPVKLKGITFSFRLMQLWCDYGTAYFPGTLKRNHCSWRQIRFSFPFMYDISRCFMIPRPSDYNSGYVRTSGTPFWASAKLSKVTFKILWRANSNKEPWFQFEHMHLKIIFLKIYPISYIIRHYLAINYQTLDGVWM